MAILHVGAPLETERADALCQAVSRVSGVGRTSFAPPEASMAVEFDVGVTGVAEIVREVEDQGINVMAVALRPLPGPALMAPTLGLRG